jgi:hypothetical protein
MKRLPSLAAIACLLSAALYPLPLSAETEWTGKFDGKDYPLTGDPTADTRSYTKVNDHTLTLENKKGGSVVTSGRIVVSADGKTRTLTASGKNAEGKKVTSKAIYDKQ